MHDTKSDLINSLSQQVEAATEQNLRQQRIIEAIADSTPDLMYVFDLNYRFTYANQALLQMWGSTWENANGKGLLDMGYEPWHAEMHEREIDQVIATKKMIRGEVSFPHATLGRRVYDYVFAPVLNSQGEVEAVAGTTRDITELLAARQVLEEKESALRNAIEVAELGTWSLDSATRICTMSPRLADWFGFDKLSVQVESVIACIANDDREQAARSLYNISSLGTDQRFDQVFRVINAKTGQKRIVHTVGRVYFNDKEQPARIEGSAQDITMEQELTTFLEQQVQQRTEELAVTNSMLAESNRELEQVNNKLLSSNENLQNFAYVASHDLQEPLRKIQQFGQMLIDRQTNLSQNELGYIERMQKAASRMSNLIQDLLDFSLISNSPEFTEIISLNEVVENVLTTLEVTISQNKAKVVIGQLPQVKGDASQLAQLFQNLLGNAIKFHLPSVPPRVQITSRTVPAAQLPSSVHPAKSASLYHQVDVTDNGIGFDEKHLDRIFQVFQRLHGKNEFAGTGIGLAICQRVATNHGGAITASSQPGHGSTFSVFFPA